MRQESFRPVEQAEPFGRPQQPLGAVQEAGPRGREPDSARRLAAHSPAEGKPREVDMRNPVVAEDSVLVAGKPERIQHGVRHNL